MMPLEQTAFGLRRPLTVTLAAVFVAVALAGAPLQWIFTLHWHDPIACLLFFTICFLIGVFVRAIYRGRTWARWLVIIWTSFFVVRVLISSHEFTLHEFTLSVPSLLGLIQLLLYVAATILLLTRPSRRWFYPLTTYERQ